MRFALALALAAAAGVAGPGCSPANAPAAGATSAPTLRIYAVSTVAGALEPCGCSKDMLGGFDHVAAFMRSEAQKAPQTLLVGAGPMLYLDPKPKAAGDGAQYTWNAEAIAGAFKAMNLTAWAPGYNDWAGGAEELGKCREMAGATLLAGNLPGMTGTLVREVGGVKVGLVGVALPRDRDGVIAAGLAASAPLEAMRAGIAAVKQQGARVLVGLAALPRGEALRLADEVPELHVLIVGKPFEAGDGNDAPKAPILAGTTLVVETANHLQTVGVIDLHVRGSKSGPLVFADAGGVARAEDLLALAARIRDLEARINSWERDGTVKAEDLAARKADLDKLRADKARLEAEQPTVGSGSFFRYATVEVRDKMGVDEAVHAAMLGYYKRVNEHNQKAYADRVPREPAKGQAGYIGLEACSECHEEARAVWDKTKHAKAYETLEKDFKQFNLDCVSCHVTGYDKPGGSTVTHVDKLKAVQCENCHGPGSLHKADPKAKGLIIGKPAISTCPTCHHPPHVEGFDPQEKIKLILGPGHGQPKADAGAPDSGAPPKK
jgi:hypothetical protein